MGLSTIDLPRPHQPRLTAKPACIMNTSAPAKIKSHWLVLAVDLLEAISKASRRFAKQCRSASSASAAPFDADACAHSYRSEDG